MAVIVGGKATVPDCVGLTLAAARAALAAVFPEAAAAGSPALTDHTTLAYSEVITAGIVMTQTPAAGSMVNPPAVVNLVVARSATIEAILGAQTVHPVHIGRFYIKDAEVLGWTGPGIFTPTGTGDIDLDDEVFVSAEGVIEASDILENQGIGAEVSFKFAVSEDIAGWIWGVSTWGSASSFWGNPGGPVFDQIIQDRRPYLGRRAVVWLGFLSDDESEVLPEIQRVFTGVMTSVGMQRGTGQASMVTLTCDQDTQKAFLAPARWLDHQSFYPGDTGSSFIVDLARGSIGGAATVGSGQNPAAGGGTQPYHPTRGSSTPGSGPGGQNSSQPTRGREPTPSGPGGRQSNQPVKP